MNATAPNDQEIPREEWPAFCLSFSRQHRGWLASLHAREGGTGGESDLAEGLPFLGLWPDPAGARLGLDLGAGGARLVHTVERPTRLRLTRTHRGADAGLRVETEDGETLELRFRAPAVPEELDGLALEER
jgi:hypothetical protein